VYTVTVRDPINPVVNPIPVYSHLTRDILVSELGLDWINWTGLSKSVDPKWNKGWMPISKR
jgi:hypothetical protein